MRFAHEPIQDDAINLDYDAHAAFAHAPSVPLLALAARGFAAAAGRAREHWVSGYGLS
jgi:hypothetical protein